MCGVCDVCVICVMYVWCVFGVCSASMHMHAHLAMCACLKQINYSLCRPITVRMCQPISVCVTVIFGVGYIKLQCIA